MPLAARKSRYKHTIHCCGSSSSAPARKLASGFESSSGPDMLQRRRATSDWTTFFSVCPLCVTEDLQAHETESSVSPEWIPFHLRDTHWSACAACTRPSVEEQPLPCPFGLKSRWKDTWSRTDFNFFLWGGRNALWHGPCTKIFVEVMHSRTVQFRREATVLAFPLLRQAELVLVPWWFSSSFWFRLKFRSLSSPYFSFLSFSLNSKQLLSWMGFSILAINGLYSTMICCSSWFWLRFRCSSPFFSLLSFLRKRVLFHHDVLALRGSGSGAGACLPSSFFFPFSGNGVCSIMVLVGSGSCSGACLPEDIGTSGYWTRYPPSSDSSSNSSGARRLDASVIDPAGATGSWLCRRNTNCG